MTCKQILSGEMYLCLYAFVILINKIYVQFMLVNYHLLNDLDINSPANSKS